MEKITLYVVFCTNDDIDMREPWKTSHETYVKVNNVYKLIDSSFYTYAEIASILEILGIEYEIEVKTNSMIGDIIKDSLEIEYQGGHSKYIRSLGKMYPSVKGKFENGNCDYFIAVKQLPNDYKEIDQDGIYVLLPITEEEVDGYWYSDLNKVYYKCRYNINTGKIKDDPNGELVKLNSLKTSHS